MMPQEDEMMGGMPMEGAPMDEMPEAAPMDAASAIDEILAGGAGTGEEILAALEGQGFMVHSESEMPGGEEAGLPDDISELMGEDPMGGEMPPEEGGGDDLLSAARFGMEEDAKKKAAAPPF
jgi:hypothetical protein